MNHVIGLTSTYSADEFGICSALYELGGMVVMHDASGCNSTYTTHDEPRWYDIDSMIYISAISEMEAIMGDDEKLINDIVETARELKPKFVAIVGAPIPYMIGTDLSAIANVVEEQLGIPAFGLEANGMNSYVSGASMAFEAVVKRFAKVVERRPNSVNIFGATPLDYGTNGSIESIIEWIEENGMEVNTCLAMGEKIGDLSDLAKADVNLVISTTALSSAKYMEEKFGIPYVVGAPVGKEFAGILAKSLLDARKTCTSYPRIKDIISETEAENMIENILERAESTVYNRPENRDKNTTASDNEIKAGSRVAVIRDAIFGRSLCESIKREYGHDVTLISPFIEDAELLDESDVLAPEEDDIIRILGEGGFDCVVGDPLYKPITPSGLVFIDLPHIAFSGRIFEKNNPNLINTKLSLLQ